MISKLYDDGFDYSNFLPNNFSIVTDDENNNGIYNSQDCLVSNCFPKVNFINDTENIACLELHYFNQDTSHKNICLYLDTLTTEITKMVLPLITYEPGQARACKELIEFLIKRQNPVVRHNSLPMLHQGMQLVNDIPIFLLGNYKSMQNGAPNLETITEYINIQLKNASKHIPVSKITNYIYMLTHNINKAIPAILCAHINALLLSTFRSCGDNESYVLYIEGRTGTQKTTVIELFSDIFQNRDNIISLSSSQSSMLDKICDFQDFTFLLDDVNLSEDNSITKSKRGKVSELIAASANSSYWTTRSGNHLIKCLLTVTAESPLTNPSTINRCLYIKWTGCDNLEILKELEEKQEYYIYFIKNFLIFLCNNYDLVYSIISNDCHNPNIASENMRNTIYGYDRIQHTKNMLESTNKVLFKYLESYEKLSSICNQYKNFAKDITDTISKSIEHCINDTSTMLLKGYKPEENIYIHRLYKALLPDSNWKIAGTYDSYKKKKKKNDSCVFFIDRDFICITTYDLSAVMHDSNNKTKTINIAKQLNHHGFLDKYQGRYPHKLSKARTYNDNANYYHISIAALREQKELYLKETDYIHLNFSKKIYKYIFDIK